MDTTQQTLAEYRQGGRSSCAAASIPAAEDGCGAVPDPRPRCVFPSQVKHRRTEAVFPGEDGGWLSFFRAVRASTDRNKGIEFASTAASHPSGEVCRHPTPDRQRVSWNAKAKTAAERHPDCGTIGAAWTDRSNAGDLWYRAPRPPSCNLPQSGAAALDCERRGCSGYRVGRKAAGT